MTAQWIQKQLRLKPRSRGCHLITDDILDVLPEVSAMRVGLLHLFLQHTSASLTINENADPAVRHDMETFLTKMVPEQGQHYRHQEEGADDLPAHIKSSLLGNSLTIPITEGRFNLGMWQGIYLCEHRNHAEARTLVVTLTGACR